MRGLWLRGRRGLSSCLFGEAWMGEMWRCGENYLVHIFTVFNANGDIIIRLLLGVSFSV
jgi:hypothetical protein